jgi:hybrid cluster-associated redox disulfide protein
MIGKGLSLDEKSQVVYTLIYEKWAYERRIVMQVNKEMIIAELIKVDPGIVEILFAAGMHCIGCPSAQGESLEMACMVHGIDADELVNQINEFLATK